MFHVVETDNRGIDLGCSDFDTEAAAFAFADAENLKAGEGSDDPGYFSVRCPHFQWIECQGNAAGECPECAVEVNTDESHMVVYAAMQGSRFFGVFRTRDVAQAWCDEYGRTFSRQARPRVVELTVQD